MNFNPGTLKPLLGDPETSDSPQSGGGRSHGDGPDRPGARPQSARTQGPRTDFDVEILPLSALPASDLWLWDDIRAHDERTSNPFFSTTFARAVDKARGGVSVLRLGDEHATIGYLPFQDRSRYPRYAEKLGGHMSDHCGIVAASGFDLRLHDALSKSRLHAFAFDHLSTEPATADRPMETSGGLTLRMPDGPDRYLADLADSNRDFVKKVRRREKALAKDYGPIRFEWHAPDPRAELDRIIAVKRDQYRRSNVPDALAAEWTRRLLRELLYHPAPSCFAVVSSLFAGSTWVASHLGLCSPPKLHCWFPAFNRDLLKYGPGHLLRRRMIGAASAAGITAFDLGEGDNPHKREYITEPYVVLKGAWRAPGLLGFGHRALTSIGWRLAARHRRVASAGSVRS